MTELERPADPGPDRGRRVVVTGANSGVGFEAARRFAREGWITVLVCRDRGRGEAALARILADDPEAVVELELCDLASLGQVRELAARLGTSAGIDLLVNNAGLVRSSLELTEDGFETTMGVNHLGHFALTLGLEDRLRASGARIVNVSSAAHTRGDLGRTEPGRVLRGEDFRGLRAYADSKQANILFSLELAHRWELEAVAVHPGVLATRIWDRESGPLHWFVRTFVKPFMGSPEKGGRIVHRAGTTTLPERFVYLDGDRIAEPAPAGRDPELAARLWEASLRAIEGA